MCSRVGGVPVQLLTAPDVVNVSVFKLTLVPSCEPRKSTDSEIYYMFHYTLRSLPRASTTKMATVRDSPSRQGILNFPRNGKLNFAPYINLSALIPSTFFYSGYNLLFFILFAASFPVNLFLFYYYRTRGKVCHEGRNL